MKKKVAAQTKKSFDLSTLKPEDGVTITPRSVDTSEMYNKLELLSVGQSYKMPMDMFRLFTNAKTTHKRVTKKIFISRRIDKYNFRTWRIADGTVLTTRRKK